MKCPKCKTDSLVEKELEFGLLSSCCEECGGNWIKLSHYWNWRSEYCNKEHEKTNDADISLQIEDSKAGKFCPECSKFIFRFKVGHGIDFYLDRCNTCGGIWLDKNEWEVLKNRNLHSDIHFIFSAPWQAKVKKEDLERKTEDFIKEKLGEEGYLKLQEITEWIKSHPNKNEILSYIKECIK